jgi:hypothetical protein
MRGPAKTCPQVPAMKSSDNGPMETRGVSREFVNDSAGLFSARLEAELLLVETPCS